MMGRREQNADKLPNEVDEREQEMYEQQRMIKKYKRNKTERN